MRYLSGRKPRSPVASSHGIHSKHTLLFTLSPHCPAGLSLRGELKSRVNYAANTWYCVLSSGALRTRYSHDSNPKQHISFALFSSSVRVLTHYFHRSPLQQSRTTTCLHLVRGDVASSREKEGNHRVRIRSERNNDSGVHTKIGHRSRRTIIGFTRQSVGAWMAMENRVGEKLGIASVLG